MKKIKVIDPKPIKQEHISEALTEVGWVVDSNKGLYEEGVKYLKDEFGYKMTPSQKNQVKKVIWEGMED